MARIRTIKPELWTDPKTGTLSPRALLLFLGMLNFADDYGVIEHCPHYLKACIFPHSTEDPTTLVAPLLLDELLPRGLVVSFSDQETKKQYLWIRNFAKHQRVDKPGKPTISGFDPSIFDEDSTKVRGGFAERSRKKALEGKGKEGKGKERRGVDGVERLETQSSPPDIDPTILATLKECRHLSDLSNGSCEEFWDQFIASIQPYKLDAPWVNMKLRQWNQWFETNPHRKSQNTKRLCSRLMGWLGKDLEQLSRRK